MSFHIKTIPNQAGKPAILLRKAWREGTRIRKKTLANLTPLPPRAIEGFRVVLKGGVAVSDLSELSCQRRAFQHGHVAAVLGVLRQLGLERVLHRARSRPRDLAVAAIVARVLRPASKLSTAHYLCAETTSNSLGVLLELDAVRGNEMLNLLDWLRRRQPWIEGVLARRHLKDATLLLYDVSSSFLEGSRCPLAAFGYNRDGKKGKRQLVFGLLCTVEGCPIAVELFPGNTADPRTVGRQVEKIRRRFGIRDLALVGDRGMLTTARIREDVGPAGLDWVSALRTADLRRLARASALAPERLEPDAVAEVFSPDFPDERLLVCLNPRLREERRRKRAELLDATEAILERIAASVGSGRLRGADRIGRRVGRETHRGKMEKHFEITIGEASLDWRRREDRIADEARLDGVYVIRTSLEDLGAEDAVAAYKSLSTVERAFRAIKTRLEIRPLYVYGEEHARGHAFLCMRAYYVEWHLRRRLAPLLFQDDDRAAAERERGGPVEKSRVSPSARAKAATKRTPDGLPVQSLESLLETLSALTLSRSYLPAAPEVEFWTVSEATRLQARAFELLDISPLRTVPISRPG